jgi:hypothetical protein
MLDSSSRLPRHQATGSADPEVDVRLEEASLFDARAIARASVGFQLLTPPPPPRRSVLPTPCTDDETTSRKAVDPRLLQELRERRESVRLLQGEAVDLSKTQEDSIVDVPEEELLETSSVRAVR